MISRFSSFNKSQKLGKYRPGAGTGAALGVNQITVEGVPPLPLVINHPVGHGSRSAMYL